MAARKKTAKKKTGAKKKTAKKRAAKSAGKKAGSARKKKPASGRKPAAKKAAKKTAKKAAKKSARKPAKKAAATKKKITRKSSVRRAPAREGAKGFTPYTAKRGEAYMNPEQVEHFRGILLGWKRSLMEEVDRTVHHMQDEASNFPDPNDRATQEEEFALELRTRDRERKLIKKIDEALDGLDNGEYGFCEVCGVEIGVKRLEARPTATLCIDCKTLAEIKEKQLG